MVVKTENVTILIINETIILYPVAIASVIINSPVTTSISPTNKPIALMAILMLLINLLSHTG